MKIRQRHPRSFTGQVAVVTGASSGIGRQLAIDLARRGATVVGLARNPALLDQLEIELQRHTPDSWTVTCDVSEDGTLVEALDKIEGVSEIDVLINNAGIDCITPAGSTELSTVRRLFEVNFFAAVDATLRIIPAMMERHRGVILNVSSDAARAPEPFQSGYSASKAALTAFTQAVSYELSGSGVRIHLLYPGWVPTNMNDRLHSAGVPLPPKSVRRSIEDVSTLVLRELGGGRIDLDAARLPLLAPIARTLSPRGFQRSMEKLASQHSIRTRAQQPVQRQEAATTEAKGGRR